MTRYQVESFKAALPELEELFPAHYEEMALDKNKVKPQADVERYIGLEEAGMLHLVTARVNEKLVGYFVWFVLGHIHYRDSGLMGYVDMYFVVPEYRNGIGGKLLIFSEHTLRDKGVRKLYLSTKLHQDHDLLFRNLGFRPTDRLYTKYIGD